MNNHVLVQVACMTEPVRANVVCMFSISSLWVTMCRLRLAAYLNCLEQIEHAYLLYSVWVTMCRLTWPAWLNCLEQTVHTYFCSPVWVTMCCFRCRAWVNCLKQMVQAYFFPPVWIIVSLRLLERVNRLSDIGRLWPSSSCEPEKCDILVNWGTGF